VHFAAKILAMPMCTVACWLLLIFWVFLYILWLFCFFVSTCDVSSEKSDSTHSAVLVYR